MSSKKRRILVLGYFGFKTNQLDGQTIKTRNVYRLLSERCDCEVRYSDTQEFRYGIKPIARFFNDLLECDSLVILPCLNNLKYIFPMAYILSMPFNYDIIHIGIGGWHDKYLKRWPLIRNMLSKIKINLLETEITAQRLHDLFKFKNVAVFPNFRFDECKRVTSSKANSKKLQLVFLARVNMKKGLDTLAELCKKFSLTGDSDKITMSIYGPIDSEEDESFLHNEIVDKFDFADYGGALDPSKINETLQNYDIFLFPTHYYTEGFPGSILDAYNAGIPVLATNWEHARQFVKHGKNGYVVDFYNPVLELYQHIMYLYNNPENLKEMKEAASNESLKYTPSSAWNILKQYIHNA